MWIKQHSGQVIWWPSHPGGSSNLHPTSKDKDNTLNKQPKQNLEAKSLLLYPKPEQHKKANN